MDGSSMRWQLVNFLTIALSIYAAINAYIFIHGWQGVPSSAGWRIAYTAVFVFLFLSFIAGRLVEREWFSDFSEVLVWTGSFWVGAMLYFFLICVLIDILRIANYLLPFFPNALTANPSRAATATLVVAVSAVALLLAGGHVNSRIIRVRTVDIEIPKKVSGSKTLNIAMAADIHLGTIIGKSRVESIVAKLNSLNPDLIILDGDVVDEDLGPILMADIGNTLRGLHAPLGVIAVTGNHEYIGGIDLAAKYLTDHNIRLLRDEVLKIRDDIYIVGREDRSRSSFNGGPRKPLAELMAQVDTTKPVILLDHQPRGLDEGASMGADLELCGHTHRGQIWPWSLATKAVYDVNYGYARVGAMQAYVTSGAGTWGPPARIGTSPEIVRIVVHFL